MYFSDNDDGNNYDNWSSNNFHWQQF